MVNMGNLKLELYIPFLTASDSDHRLWHRSQLGEPKSAALRCKSGLSDPISQPNVLNKYKPLAPRTLSRSSPA